MSEQQHELGGSRKTSPLADEDCYPLTLNEYLSIKDNLILDKWNSLETMLFSIFISTFISGIIFYNTNSFYSDKLINNETTEIVNLTNIFIMVLYSGISLGCLIGFGLYRFNSKSESNTMERLDEKILKHLEEEK